MLWYRALVSRYEENVDALCEGVRDRYSWWSVVCYLDIGWVIPKAYSIKKK